MSSTTRQILRSALTGVLPEQPGIAVIHTALHELYPDDELTRWDVLAVFSALVDRGWTIALPAFTFSFCQGKSFNQANSASEVGVIADHLLKHFPDARRTAQPIYSFAVLGPRAEAIAACQSSTTFGDDSPFALFEREAATIVMLGCDWLYNTAFHRFEEMAQVPYRYPKTFSGTADFGTGPQTAESVMWVRDLALNPRNDFSPAIDALRKQGQISHRPLWRGRVEAVSMQALAKVCRTALADDPYVYVANRNEVIHARQSAEEAAQQGPLKIAILAQTNTSQLETAWLETLKTLLPERMIASHTLPFGQRRQAMLDTESSLHHFQPDIRVFCDRIEDIVGNSDAHETADMRVVEYAKNIADFHRQQGGWSIVHLFAQCQPPGDAASCLTGLASLTRLNQLLIDRLAGLPQIAWVNLASETAAHSGPVQDPRLWLIGRIPFSQSFSQQLARRWAGLTLAAIGKTARLIVTDLDNTLWGGVLGEDGLAGIQIGSDYPGNAFAAYQRTLKQFSERGIALAISSKNDADLVGKALAEHPEMQLRAQDFVAQRCNWQAKSENIRDIAAELNLGLASVLFIDDNPVEREAVRRALPEVKVLDLPTDPALYASALLDSPWLAAIHVTNEDRQRNADFQRRRQRSEARQKTANLEDFYASLGMTLHLAPLNAGNSQRAAQLCQKTNQFNTTTRRHDLSALEHQVAAGCDVVVVGLEDRDSPFENIGLLILEPVSKQIGNISLYLLSCRVLGRGIETAIVHWAVGRAQRRGWRELQGEIIETERNTPVRKIFEAAGFTEMGEGRWRTATDPAPALPAWLGLADQFISS